ncbi:transcriptional regulator [Clostridiaceae bacterium UIB06]|uniref:Transcriptional regulator n=1 Tax=Clostridium thailandense TaxID=2794346 RepID=A0A949X3S0_9CLOT|nr:transcriptional regulator [Clostridium thailandense]MBV7275164.1 transcriptional regulator [Clostridium thailandense]MCH5137832.1 transcriptional regulator [Clostridiaceae bacterium UIB06]
MLMKILRRLAQGGMYSNKIVSKELGIDEGIIEQMIIQLKQLGYIEKEKLKDCSSGYGCNSSSCSSKNNSCCSNHNIDINIWKVTEKGRKAIAG